MHHTELLVYADADALYAAAADRWLELAEDAIADQGEFHVALAGGNTPRGLYRLLAQTPYKQAIDWPHVHIYFGDERCVASDHPDSNYRMAYETLLSQVPIPPEQIHRIPADMADHQAAAEAYSSTLKHCLPSVYQLPIFDLVLLGIGDDGHIASLFPGTPALDESNRLTTAVYVEKFNSWRISLTLPVINNASHIIILASGDAKAAILKQILGNRATQQQPPLPAQRVRARGELAWLVDAAAARHIKTD